MPHDGAQIFSKENLRQSRYTAARNWARNRKDARIDEKRDEFAIRAEQAYTEASLDEYLATQHDEEALIAEAEQLSYDIHAK